MNPASPTALFGEFLGQLPTGLFVVVCGSFLLLMVAFSWFAFFKPRRKARLEAQSTGQAPLPNRTPNFAQSTMNTPSTPNTSDPMLDYVLNADDLTADADMPDLGSLLDTSGFEGSPPSSTPQAAPPPTSNPPLETSDPLPFEQPPPKPAPAPTTTKPIPPLRKPGNYRVKLNTGDYIRTEEVVAVMRDPRDGRLVVQIGETAYRTLVDTPEARQEFTQIMKELATVVSEPDDNPPEIEEALQNPIAARPPTPRSGQMPGALPKYSLDDSVTASASGLFGGVKYDPAPVPELNLAQAIEAYLQHKLRYIEDYAERQIHVHPAPGGGVRIQVDDTYYEAVSDVADPEIREFLAATIQEWQEQQ